MSIKPQRLTKRAQQAIESKNNIIKGYFRLVKDFGADGFTVADLCEYLNISVGQFYHYFKSKDDVAREVYFAFIEMVAKWREEYEEADALTNLMQYFQWFACYHADLQFDIVQKIMNAETPLPKQRERNEDGPEESWLHFYTKAFWEEYGLSSYYDLEELVRHFEIVTRGLLFDWALHDGKYDLVTVTLETMSSVIDGIFQTKEGKHLYDKS